MPASGFQNEIARDCTSLNRTAQLLRLIFRYAASAILCEALAPAVFSNPHNVFYHV
jgi:hypothetical protein